MSLEEQALERKKRLAQLRGVKRDRNYDTEAQSAKLGFDGVNNNDETVEFVADDLQEQALKDLKEKTLASKLQVENLKPKSTTWDLQRELQPELDELEKRTQDAILNLVRERIKKSREETKDA